MSAHLSKPKKAPALFLTMHIVQIIYISELQGTIAQTHFLYSIYVLECHLKKYKNIYSCFAVTHPAMMQ